MGSRYSSSSSTKPHRPVSKAVSTICSIAWCRAMGHDQDPVIGGTVILPLAVSVLDFPPGGTHRPDSSRPARPTDDRTTIRPRDERVAMIGAGYRAVIEGRPAALVNLS